MYFSVECIQFNSFQFNLSKVVTESAGLENNYAKLNIVLCVSHVLFLYIFFYLQFDSCYAGIMFLWYIDTEQQMHSM